MALNDLMKANLVCNITEVDLATDADVVVTSKKAILLGVYVQNDLSAHPAIIKDSSTAKITLPASTSAGVNINAHSGLFDDNITVESDNAATGKLLIFWSNI